MTIFRPGWDSFPEPLWDMWTAYHICTLTTLRRDGSPHVVPVGVALDPEQECAWAITREGSRKVRNLREGDGRLAACQVDGPRWSTLEGRGTVVEDDASVARAVERYTSRYRTPHPQPARVAIRIEVDRFVHGPALA